MLWDPVSSAFRSADLRHLERLAAELHPLTDAEEDIVAIQPGFDVGRTGGTPCRPVAAGNMLDTFVTWAQ